jgi:hypothetical protein
MMRFKGLTRHKLSHGSGERKWQLVKHTSYAGHKKNNAV